MSKAFTRESDDLPEEPLLVRAQPALPPGAKNYLTERGERQLQEELEGLVEIRRGLVSAKDDPEKSRRLPAIEQRISDLRQSLFSAIVVPKPAATDGPVRFGATVKVRDSRGEPSSYRIVGVDETDLDRGWVSWVSPIAKALLNARLGERVRFRSPSGDEELEIVEILYE